MRAGSLPHPLRVGIDGPDGSGKTALSAELAAVLRSRGVDVIEANLDDFHHPREVRYSMGRHSWEGYWAGAFNYTALRANLLEPLGDACSLTYRTKLHDLARDAPVDAPRRTAEPGAMPLQRRDQSKCEPRGRADIVVDNSDPAAPHIVSSPRSVAQVATERHPSSRGPRMPR